MSERDKNVTFIYFINCQSERSKSFENERKAEAEPSQFVSVKKRLNKIKKESRDR